MAAPSPRSGFRPARIYAVRDSYSRVRHPEQQAFTIALEAYAVLTPKQSVDDIVDGNRRGYNADERFALDYWSNHVFVIPAIGTDATGKDVHGYWYDMSGSGTLIPTGPARTKFLRMILSRQVRDRRARLPWTEAGCSRHQAPGATTNSSLSRQPT